MSGRSAYVRKGHPKTRDPLTSDTASHSSSTVRAGDSEQDSLSRSSTQADHRPAKPPVKQKQVIEKLEQLGQVERSSFRSLMDKKSDGVRKGLAKTFGKKKKEGKDYDRPETATGLHENIFEVEADVDISAALAMRPRQSNPSEKVHRDNPYPHQDFRGRQDGEYEEEFPISFSHRQRHPNEEQYHQGSQHRQHEYIQNAQPRHQQFHQGQQFNPPPKTQLTMSPSPKFSGLPPQLPLKSVSKSQFPPPAHPPPKSKVPATPKDPKFLEFGAQGPKGSTLPPQPWNKLFRDPELWDEQGDVLIYLDLKSQNSSAPIPSFRVASHVLERLHSPYFIHQLRNGYVEEHDHFNYQQEFPPSPISSPGMGSGFHLGPNKYQTPPTSENRTLNDCLTSYELVFDPPAHLDRIQTIKHQIVTRNVFAVIYGKSLVGLDLRQALIDVHQRLKEYLSKTTDVTQVMVNYVCRKGFDDVRHNHRNATAMLAWAGSDGVRWVEGWREFFTHCAGMYDDICNDRNHSLIPSVTDALLEQAMFDLDERLKLCEARLLDFDFGDMFPMNKVPSVARKAFEDFCKFLTNYYQKKIPTWPHPGKKQEDHWLTREVVQTLQADFGALYNFIVNRECTWENAEASSGRKWNIVMAGDKSFSADTPHLPFTDILVGFDNRHHYPHIPHPYPIVPPSLEAIAGDPSKENTKSSKKSKIPDNPRMAERKANQKYLELTNTFALGDDLQENKLVAAFRAFEKPELAVAYDPVDSRKGRWILIYGVLQTLATISVEVPNLQHTEGVKYHLNVKLPKAPWKNGPGASQMAQARHEDSFCWTVPRTWVEDPSADEEGTDSVTERPLTITQNGHHDSGSTFDDTPLLLRGLSSPKLNSTPHSPAASHQSFYNGPMSRNGSSEGESGFPRTLPRGFRNPSSRPGIMPTSPQYSPDSASASISGSDLDIGSVRIAQAKQFTVQQGTGARMKQKSEKRDVRDVEFLPNGQFSNRADTLDEEGYGDGMGIEGMDWPMPKGGKKSHENFRNKFAKNQIRDYDDESGY
jgi:hypothetical protein